MMERAEKAGLGIALVGHAALFALLSLRLLTRPLPVPPPEQAIEVSLAPDVALQQASPSPAPPAPSEAPELGAPEEAAAPPPPAPQPVAKPKPAPAKPAPAKPSPARLAAVVADAERADAGRADRAAAKATAHAAWVEKVKAENATKAAAHAAWVERVQAENAAKADAARAAADKAAAAKATAAAAKAQEHAAWVEKVKAANAAKADAARLAADKAAAARAAAAARPRGSRLGNDFLKGLADTQVKAPASPAAPGATMNAKALAGINDVIRRQIQPCADRQVNPAVGQAERIRVTLNLRLNRDGSLAAPPRVVNHEGLDVDNRRYLDRVDDLAIAAFVGCAPLRGLPPELYDVPNGWRSILMKYKLPG